MYFINRRTLIDAATKAPVTDFLLASAGVITTQGIKVEKNVGFFILWAKENKAGSGGAVGIVAEYSDDDVTYDRVYTTSAGTLTQEAAVVTTLDNKTRRIVFTARLARYVRFVITAAADSQVSGALIFQEDE